jgi:starch phosphorylase
VPPNEGHAALLVLERARRFMHKTGVSFQQAWWATRAGNVFTTHTPVAAGFDVFPAALVLKYARGYLDDCQLVAGAAGVGPARPDGR